MRAFFFCSVVMTCAAARGQFVQQGAKLVGADAAGRALQGGAVAVSADGNTALVGGAFDNGGADVGVGAAWVFTRDSSGQWSQQGPKLVGSDATGAAGQGTSVALSSDGNTALVGGASDSGGDGAVWVFTRDGNGTWSQQGSKLSGAGAIGPAAQGSAVALSGDGNTALVGAVGDNPDQNGAGDGAVWVFTRDGNGTWSQQGSKLVGSGAVGKAGQGAAVSLSADGNTAIVGAWSDNSSGGELDVGTGAVWVFTRRAGGNWDQQGSKLVGSGAVGAAAQGASVALSADGATALVGGWGDNSSQGSLGAGVGAAWVFTRDSSGNWSQQGSKLTGSDAAGSAQQGSSVALAADGATALVGGPGDNKGAGAVWIFMRDTSGNWTQHGNKLIGSGAAGPANQGSAAALSADGNTAVVGGIGDNPSGFLGAGAVWVFTRQ